MEKSQEKALSTSPEIRGAKLKEGASVSRYRVKPAQGSGLWLEVREGRSKRFVYRFRLGGKQAFFVIGTFKDKDDDDLGNAKIAGQKVTLAKARELHAAALKLVDQGIDPRYAKRETKAENESARLLGDYFEEWLTFKTTATGRKKDAAGNAKKLISERTAKDYLSIYKNHIKDRFANWRIKDIAREDLIKHCRAMQTSSAAGSEAIRKLLTVLTQVFEHALDAGLIEDNPAATLKPSKFQAQQGEARDRWLPKNELRLLWRALEEATNPDQLSSTIRECKLASSVVLSQSVANVIRLIILTGVRRSEAVGMRWEQIRGDRWTIPQTKNGKPHLVALSPLALEIIKQQRALSGGPYVFESTSKAGQPITGDAVTKALIRLHQKRLAEIDPFTVHDLRRSFANGCGIELGASLADVEGALNHQISDKLLRTYQGAALRDPERIKALFLRWGQWVAEQVVPEMGCAVSSGDVVQVLFGKR